MKRASPFPPGEEQFAYLLIDGGQNERRDFFTHPKSKGFLSFTPAEGACPFYLIHVDDEGYEHPLDVFEDKESVMRAADFHWNDFGIVLLIDVTTTPPTKKIYSAEDIPTKQ